MRVRRGSLHQHRNRAPIRNSREPAQNTLLRARASEVARRQTHAPLRAGVLSSAQLLEGLLDALGGRAGEDRVSGEAGVVEGAAHAREHVGALAVRQVHRLARAAEHHEPPDPRPREVQRVRDLRVHVQRRDRRVVVRRLLAREEGRYWDVDPWWWDGGGHGVCAFFVFLSGLFYLEGNGEQGLGIDFFPYTIEGVLAMMICVPRDMPREILN